MIISPKKEDLLSWLSSINIHRFFHMLSPKETTSDSLVILL
jgi:hypothetical protein